MADYRRVRISVLEFLGDVKHGRLPGQETPRLGVNGEHIYNHRGEGLTMPEFKAQLDYLEEKGTVIRKPPEMPGAPKTKAEELKLSWYSITAAGMDEIENKAIESRILPDNDKTSPLPFDRPRVFIVHGHDLQSLEKLDHLLRKIGLEPENFDTLKKEGSETVIEILERSMPTCDAVIALLTPDDEGRKCPPPGQAPETHEPLKPRARQNVLIEAGYAIISSRRRSLIIALGGVDIPTDFEGISRIQAHSWTNDLAGNIAKRFSQMGFSVNLQSLV